MTEVRLKMRGTTAECDGTKSQLSHLVHDTQRNNLRIYDGIQMGGHEILNKTNLTAHVLDMFADPLTTVYNSDHLGGELPSYYLNASNISSGTLADARLPSTQTGKKFTSTVHIEIADAATPGAYLLAVPTDYGVGKPRFYISKPTAILDRWDIGLYDTVNNDGNINIVASSFTHRGFTIWDSNNDGAGSGLDADLLDGQHGSYYTNAASLITGVVPSARMVGVYGGITGVGALNSGSIGSGFGNINIGSSIFTGDGSGLTNLNATRLTTGFLSNDRLNPTGTYSFGTLRLAYNLELIGSGYIQVDGAVGNAAFNIANNSEGWKMGGSVGARLDIVSQEQWAILLKRIGSNGQIMQFRRTGTTGVGSISVTTSGTSFDTSSDERLKEDLRPIDTSILDKIDAFDFRWKVDGTRGQGFMAQRVYGLIPMFAMHHQHDDQDYWTADYSKITPLLTAVVKEQRVEIKELHDRIAKLEQLVAGFMEGLQ